MVVVSLSPAERDAILTRSLTTLAFGRTLVVCRSMSPLDVTSYHGTADKVTVVLGKTDVERMRTDGVCKVTVGFSCVQIEVSDAGS